MTGLLEKTSEKKRHPFKYTYGQMYFSEKEYGSVIKYNFDAYNIDMKQNTVFMQTHLANYQEIRQYYKDIAKNSTQIESNPEKLDGMPIVKNTRIPVSLIVACLKDEMTLQEICQEYQLGQDDIENAMNYVIEILDVPYQKGQE